MEYQHCRKKGYYGIGFLDPDILHMENIANYPNRTTTNIFNALMAQHTCSLILFPYLFGLVVEHILLFLYSFMLRF